MLEWYEVVIPFIIFVVLWVWAAVPFNLQEQLDKDFP